VSSSPDDDYPPKGQERSPSEGRPLKSYTTAVKAKAEEGTDAEGLVRFEIDGHEVTASRPSDAMIAIIIARTGKRSSQAEVAAAAIDFFYSVLDPKSQRYIEDRLFDNQDDFGLEEVLEVLFDLIEEWTGRPTVRPSGS